MGCSTTAGSSTAQGAAGRGGAPPGGRSFGRVEDAAWKLMGEVFEGATPSVPAPDWGVQWREGRWGWGVGGTEVSWGMQHPQREKGGLVGRDKVLVQAAGTGVVWGPGDLSP